MDAREPKPKSAVNSQSPTINLTGLHLLLTYRCNYECDHCFVWSGPRAADKALSLAEIDAILEQAVQLGTVEMIYFEGGEPFLHYPILVQAVERASARGFRTGIVSNGYWATSVDRARERLRPLVDAGLDVLTLSADELHGGGEATRRVEQGVATAKELGLSPGTIVTARPEENRPYPDGAGGSVMFRGRAAVKLVDRVAHHPWQCFTSCPHEKLADPARVHVDPFGYVHLCQGLVMGNLFERPLVQLVAEYHAAAHPIVGPLLEQGPAGLIERYDLPKGEYADACHLCYTARSRLRQRFPAILAPDAMYGQAAGNAHSEMESRFR